MSDSVPCPRHSAPEAQAQENTVAPVSNGRVEFVIKVADWQPLTSCLFEMVDSPRINVAVTAVTKGDQ